MFEHKHEHFMTLIFRIITLKRDLEWKEEPRTARRPNYNFDKKSRKRSPFTVCSKSHSQSCISGRVVELMLKCKFSDTSS